MFAALPMYDFVPAATDAFWTAIRASLRAVGIAAPEALARGGDLHAVWRDPALLLGQTCGYPYWTTLRGDVEILATPIYGFEGCDGPAHCSFLIARRDDARGALADFRGARAAVNAWDSNSGMNLFRAAVAPLAGGRTFFSDVVVTGAHARSLAAVAEGQADLAAIDCVSFALLAEGTGAVKIIGRTPSSPALPFIASRTLPAPTLAALRAALAQAAEQPAIGLRGVAFLPETAYARVAEIEREAQALGYPRLA
jgi:ABC-type phosphate/phosphonate transport system substrate-binding protein